MAKRKPPRKPPTPPTPILTGAAARKRVAAIRAKRTRETKSARANLAKATAAKKRIGGNAFEVTREILEEESLQEWSGDRGRVERFWDESWTYETDGDVSYDEMLDWRYKLVRNRTIAEYFEGGRAVSVILVVESHGGKRRGKMYLTGAASADYETAMALLRKNLRDWAESYGREARGDDFTRVREVTFLIRRGGVHGRWRSIVKGRAEERERAEDRTRAARRKASKPKKRR